MTDVEFRVLLDLCMVNDPWPLDQLSGCVFLNFLTQESQKRGYPDWVTAYHLMI